MLISKRQKEIMEKILYYKKKINDVDTKVTLYLSDKKKYPHPGHESFIEEVRRFENRVHSYPDKDIGYFLDNLMESLRIHEKIWRQKFINHENKRKNIFSENEIKEIYKSFVDQNEKKGVIENLSYDLFKERFSKAVKIKSENLSSNETLKIKYTDNGQIRLKKEKIEQF
ncbi:MAG: hypothetical protein H6680_00455 [Desulfobacteraceae bacterium]|nr:hypothetical protein [Desulfobacteraceae bacterium]